MHKLLTAALIALSLAATIVSANSINDYNNLSSAQKAALDNNTSNSKGQWVTRFKTINGKTVRVLQYVPGGTGNGGSCHTCNAGRATTQIISK